MRNRNWQSSTLEATSTPNISEPVWKITRKYESAFWRPTVEFTVCSFSFYWKTETIEENLVLDPIRFLLTMRTRRKWGDEEKYIKRGLTCVGANIITAHQIYLQVGRSRRFAGRPRFHWSKPIPLMSYRSGGFCPHLVTQVFGDTFSVAYFYYKPSDVGACTAWSKTRHNKMYYDRVRHIEHGCEKLEMWRDRE